MKQDATAKDTLKKRATAETKIPDDNIEALKTKTVEKKREKRYCSQRYKRRKGILQRAKLPDDNIEALKAKKKKGEKKGKGYVINGVLLHLELKNL